MSSEGEDRGAAWGVAESDGDLTNAPGQDEANAPRGANEAREGGPIGIAPQPPQGMHGLWARAASGPEIGAPAPQMLQYTLTVPFRTNVEAEIARGSLVRQMNIHVQVYAEIMVTGNVLAIRLIAEDPVELRICITHCLDHLSMVVRALQPFVPPFGCRPRRGEGF
ncbi:PREDICTED: EKC/KEOPS complex subunit LAGE3-like [Chrysochloris asiatica]|uniref:EKC/KEOPS complex subunit LAGE3-like n=1 Tax=Chrysochloris asiatica TaxID=185453 RepID=A0A9B0U9S2_CHRAS|nr:PREDICTED: EKC/KEOPS complex subunit LAGE3-like [Chrysochloris asiatica]